MTRKNVSQWHQQSLDVAKELSRLESEVDRLTAENTSLRKMLDLIDASGGTSLSVEVAHEIGEALRAQPQWQHISLGKGGSTHWSTRGGYPNGGGLLGLIDDLMAIDGTDVILGISWDARERRKAEARKDYSPRPRPDRFFNHNSVAWDLSNKRESPHLAEALNSLTKGLRSRTLKAFIECSFLLWGDDAIKCLRDDPEMAVATVLSEIARAYAKAGDEAAEQVKRLFGDLFGGFASNKEMLAEARATLGIPEDADGAAIKRAWREKAKTHHPDMGGDPEHFNALTRAYELLTA